MILEVKNVSHGFRGKKVLNRVQLQIAAGQIVALVGPSGCGKSTLLRAILGTHPPQQGEILASGHPVTRPGRDVGIVYQDYSLYEFLSARDNVAFGLMLDQTSLWDRCFRPIFWKQLREGHHQQALEMLQKVNLSHAATHFPSEMSGGMRQRVAIAQALVMHPKILLLDEPFGALDEATREELQLMLLRLADENRQAMENGETPPYTILIVTHELNEAIYVSERVIGLSQFHEDGQNGATIVYDKPSPIFRPGDPRDYEQFETQREELRQVVFNPSSRGHATEHVTFWSR